MLFRSHYLWRAVDHEGEVLECFVTEQRDRKPALKPLKNLMKRHERRKMIVTDRLQSHGAALNDVGRGGDGGKGRWATNPAENAHQPFRKRERAKQRFRRMRRLHKFASDHASIHNHFNPDAALPVDRTSRPTVPLLSLTGVNFARPDRVGFGQTETGSHWSDNTAILLSLNCP